LGDWRAVVNFRAWNCPAAKSAMTRTSYATGSTHSDPRGVRMWGTVFGILDELREPEWEEVGAEF
jgi:hypothetical protein